MQVFNIYFDLFLFLMANGIFHRFSFKYSVLDRNWRCSCYNNHPPQCLLMAEEQASQ